MKNHDEVEDRSAKHGSDIGSKIEAGYAAAQRGELIDADNVRSLMEERKRVWIAGKRQTCAVK